MKQKEITNQIKKSMKEMLKIMGTKEFNQVFSKTQFPSKNKNFSLFVSS